MSDFTDARDDDAGLAASALLPESLQDAYLLPTDDRYDDARRTWNTLADLHPAAVAVPRSVSDVQALVRAVSTAGLRIAPMSTGHAGPLFLGRDLSRTVIMKLDQLTGATIDPAARTARVIGGTVWNEVVAAAAEHGLTAVHGSAGDVGVVGYALSGGLSFYGRRHGLAVNTVRAVELVTADGELVRASADENPTLFWALRGGNGNFGVVVAIEIDLVPYSDVYAGMLLWPADRAREVMRAWRDLTANAPESITTSFRILSFPPMPELPPFLSGRSVVIIDGIVLEADAEAARILAPLTTLAPDLNTFGRMSARDVFPMHMDPPTPTPAVGESAVLAELTDAAIDAFIAQLDRDTSHALSAAELRQLGGAIGRPAPDGGAISHIDGAYLLFAAAVAPDAETAERGTRAADALCRALEPWVRADSNVLTFVETDHGAGVYGSAREGLTFEAERIDPRGVFQAGHSLRERAWAAR